MPYAAVITSTAFPSFWLDWNLEFPSVKTGTNFFLCSKLGQNDIWLHEGRRVLNPDASTTLLVFICFRGVVHGVVHVKSERANDVCGLWWTGVNMWAGDLQLQRKQNSRKLLTLNTLFDSVFSLTHSLPGWLRLFEFGGVVSLGILQNTENVTQPTVCIHT